MKALSVLLIGFFVWVKFLGERSMPAFLGSSGVLPPWLHMPTYMGNALATLFCSDALFLGLALLTFRSLARLLSDNAVGFEWPWILGGAAILHAVVGKHLGIVTVGPVASIAAALSFELVFRWRLSSLRHARSTILAGVAALFLSPESIFLGSICGSIVGAGIAVCIARERKLCRLLFHSNPTLVTLPPAGPRASIDDILEKYGRKSA